MSAVVWRPGTGIVCGGRSTGVRGTVVRSAVPAAAGGAGLTGGGAGGKGGAGGFENRPEPMGAAARSP